MATKKALESEEKKVKKATKTTAKKSTTKKETKTTKKAVAKKEPKKETKTKTKAKATKKATTKVAKIKEDKKATKSTVKKTTAKKASTKTKKTTVSKKVSEKKETKVKKTTTRKSTKKSKIEVVEYYDLPFTYGKTIVKMLYQTPTRLFVYWDIADEDRKSFIKKYGDDFFDKTYPVLIIRNETLDYSYEIPINDFANTWYFEVNYSNCKYSAELGRRFKELNNNENYIYVSDSNNMDAPNDHILFDENLKTVFFKNVKTNIIREKDITSLVFLKNIGKIYKLCNVNADFESLDFEKLRNLRLDITNPSSTFK